MPQRLIHLAPSLTRTVARLHSEFGVWELPSKRKLASVPAPEAPSAGSTWCVWSTCSTAVAFRDQASFIGLLDLRTGQGSTTRSQRRLGRARCLPGQQGLLLYGGPEWLVLQPAGGGGLASHDFPVKPAMPGSQLAISALGSMAYAAANGARTLVIWAPGTVCRVCVLQTGVLGVAWAPAADLLACSLAGCLVVLTAEGQAFTQLKTPGHPSQTAAALERLRPAFRCAQQGRQQAGHVRRRRTAGLVLPAGLCTTSSLALGPDGTHVAFSARSGECRNLFVVPASPARARVLGGKLPNIDVRPTVQWNHHTYWQ